MKDICEACGWDEVIKTTEDTMIEMNHRGKIYKIPLKLPVYSCNYCELQYTDCVAEEITDKATKKYMSWIDKQIEMREGKS